MNNDPNYQAQRRSAGYVLGKVRERGLVWVVRAAAKRLASLLAAAVAFVPAIPIGWLGIRFLSTRYANPERIGELAHQPDLYVKMGLIGWRPAYHGVLLARPKGIANLCLLGYWRRYIRVVTHPLLVRALSPLAARLEYNTAFVRLSDGRGVHKNRATIAVQKQWEAEGRPALLALSLSDCERGWRCLEELGIPDRAWFVCLHVREAGFLNEGNDPYHAYRNADVNTYSLAIKEIVARGGWVIRMGDPTMKPLPPMDHVIDYAHSAVRSDWMDVFCCAQCRFFLGTTSGLFLVSFVFGVPCVLTNVAPMQERPWSGKDVFIPKLYWSETEKRYLPFKEGLVPPLGDCYDGNVLVSLGVRVVDNTPAEINNLVVEMLDRLDGSLQYTEEDEHLQARFNALATYESYEGSSRIGQAFLRKYAWLLPGAMEKDDL